MKDDILYATGLFEIGDAFFDGEGNAHVVTDVRVCHYLRDGLFHVSYEVDNSGEYIDLITMGFDGDAPVKKPKAVKHTGQRLIFMPPKEQKNE